MRTRALGLAAAAAVAVSAAGCGGGDEGGKTGRSARDADGVRAVALALIDDLAKGRYKHACNDLLTREARKQTGGGEEIRCEARLNQAASTLGTAGLERLKARARTVRVTIDGDTATAPSLTGRRTTSHYRYVNGRWYAAADNGK